MVKVGLLVRLKAKPGKEGQVESFLVKRAAARRSGTGDDSVVCNQDGTINIWDFRCLPRRRRPRQAHLTGPIAAALMAQAADLLAEAPTIEKIDVLAAKLPG